MASKLKVNEIEPYSASTVKFNNTLEVDTLEVDTINVNNTLAVDTISEKTSANGDSIDGYVIKDGTVPFTWATPVATTSGTSASFVGIPATASEIIFVVDNLSTDGTDETARVKVGYGSTPTYTSTVRGGTGTKWYNATGRNYFYPDYSAGEIMASPLQNAARYITTILNYTKLTSTKYSVTGTAFQTGAENASFICAFIDITSEITAVSIRASAGATFDSGTIYMGYR